MQILFAISIVSFLVFALAGVAIIRHIRMGHKHEMSASRPQPDFSQHLFRATENRDVRLPQEVRFQSVKEIAANKTWNAPSKLVEIPPAPGQISLGKRKGPQSARPETGERLDWAYFNKDYGDLSDPYESRPVRAKSGAKSTLNRRF